MEKECGALGGLFQHIIQDMRVSVVSRGEVFYAILMIIGRWQFRVGVQLFAVYLKCPISYLVK